MVFSACTRMGKCVLNVYVDPVVEQPWTQACKGNNLLLRFANSNDQCRCNAEDILLEMDRILRPEGAVIFRDQADVLLKVKKIVKGMRWNTKMVDHEDGPMVSEKMLFAVKQYWVAGDNTTSSE